ncbi:MAG: tetratricopeptide repeat protein [Candidatus Thorarchaeota archaeon]
MSEAEAKTSAELADYLKTIHAMMSANSSSKVIPERMTGSIVELDEALAERAWISSMLLEPKNPSFWNAFALVYMMNGDYEAAENAIDSSLEIDTGIAWTWRIWGDLFLRMGRSGEAERAYRMSLELESWNAHSMRQISILYMQRGAFPEAAKLISRLLLTTPNNQDLWDSLTHCVRNSL